MKKRLLIFGAIVIVTAVAVSCTSYACPTYAVETPLEEIELGI